jgi:NTE family protein
MPDIPRSAHQDETQRPAAYDKAVALVLQGGGALGSYQAGVYEALSQSMYRPDLVAGISIGAINAAIIAGNAPEHRVERLRQFWEATTAPTALWEETPLGIASEHFRRSAAMATLLFGQPGFFAPLRWHDWFGGPHPTSYYATAALKSTLERLVDFDRINAREIRFSVGAVNVRNGRFAYFDNAEITIRPEHVMASGALPPGFPAVEIDGEHYWDGGLVSNTPLQWVVDNRRHLDTLIFQVDLWSARGELPGTLAEVSTRKKEIRYSSRTRAGTDSFNYVQRLRRAMTDLIEKLPDDLRTCPEVQLLRPVSDHKVYNIAHLIYRARNYEGHSKDYDFSRASMQEHWRAGYHDAIRTLRHPEVLERPTNHEGVFTFDLLHDGRE